MKFLARVVDIVTFCVVLLIGLRVALKVAGANVIAPFVAWLYSTTGELLVPFEGIFPSPPFGRSGIIDIPALFALVVYLAAGYFISELLDYIGRNTNFGKFLKIKK